VDRVQPFTTLEAPHERKLGSDSVGCRRCSVGASLNGMRDRGAESFGRRRGSAPDLGSCRGFRPDPERAEPVHLDVDMGQQITRVLLTALYASR
jgi:hypothetical protein